MRTKTVQSSFLSGVLDPRALGRVETDAYNNGLYTGSNVVVHHLGGARRRYGMRFLERLSNVLSFNEPDSATAPEGGTAANGYDQDETTAVVTTGNIGTVDPYIVLRYDMGSAITPRHIDIRNIKLTGSSGDTSEEFVLQRSVNDSTWISVAAFYVTETERSYRFTYLTGGATQYWRIAKVGGTDLGTQKVSVQEFSIWTETSTISNVRILPFELNTDEQYVVVLTDRAGFIYESGSIVSGGYFYTPFASADLPELDAAVGSDSLFMVHEDYAPRYLVKDLNGTLGHTDFQSAPIEFDTVPQYDFNDDDSPTPTSEVQVITFDANWVGGDTFQIELDGARTGLISFAGDSTSDEQTTTATNIAREVQKLYTVPGFSGVTCARTNTLEYTVTFADESAKPYDGLMSVTVGTTTSTTTPAAVVTQTTPGVSRHENVWSSARGYPRTVTFFEGRLYFGGTRDKEQSLFGSAVNVITEFELLEALDADPLFVTLNGQQLNAINGLFSGRSLQLFTSGGEFRYAKSEGEAITPADAPVAQTQYGSKKIRPVSVDGATVFIQRLGKSVRDFRFDFEENAYNSLGLSALAPHLINDVIDITAWQGSSTDEINLIFVVNGDGTMAILNLRREADVRAWTSWSTDGSIKAAGAAVEDVYFATQRTIDSTDYLFLEVMDDDMYMDASVLRTVDDFNVTDTTGVDGTITIAQLDHLDGESCRLTIGGFVFDDITPSSGQAVVTIPESFPFESDTEVRVGLNYDPELTPMALQTLTPIGSNFVDKRRVRKVRARLYNTLGLLVNGRVIPESKLDVTNFDDPVSPFTGIVTFEETTNWDEDEDKFLPFTQVDPLPMHVLAIAVDMESS